MNHPLKQATTGSKTQSDEGSFKPQKSVLDFSLSDENIQFYASVARKFSEVKDITPAITAELVKSILVRSRLLSGMQHETTEVVNGIAKLLFEHSETRARLNQLWSDLKACQNFSDSGHSS